MSHEPNPHLLARLKGIRHALVAHHSGGASLPNASKGSERERFISTFLEQIFPAPFRFGSGSITDSSGACSGQIDIVVEYPFLPSFPMPGGTERLYLAESVALVLEVKSNVAAQWDQVERSLQRLRTVRRRWLGSTRLIGSGIAFGAPSESSIPCIAVGYTGYADPEALEDRLDRTPLDCRPDGVLVIDSGVFIGPGCRAVEEFGLFALAYLMMRMAHAASSAEADLASYVVEREEK